MKTPSYNRKLLIYCILSWKNNAKDGAPKSTHTHTGCVREWTEWTNPTGPGFQVYPSYDSPLSWPSTQAHCAPWRLLLWRWEFAGSHLCSAAWEGKKKKKKEWESCVLWFVYLLGPWTYCDWEGKHLSQICKFDLLGLTVVTGLICVKDCSELPSGKVFKVKLQLVI